MWLILWCLLLSNDNYLLNILSQPNQPQLNILSQPNQPQLDILSLPNQPQLDTLSQPNQPQLYILSQPNQTQLDILSQPKTGILVNKRNGWDLSPLCGSFTSFWLPVQLSWTSDPGMATLQIHKILNYLNSIDRWCTCTQELWGIWFTLSRFNNIQWEQDHE